MMTDDEDFEPLPSMMGLVAAGDTRPEIVAWARQERRMLRRQAFDDQILSALLARYGGDPATAALYWRLSRTVLALSSGSVRFKTVDDALDFFADQGIEPLGS